MYFNADEIVIESIEFISDNYFYDEVNVSHITYGTDRAFLMGCAVSIVSVLRESRGKNLHFHVFTDELNEDEKNKFKEISSQYKTKVTIHFIDKLKLTLLPVNKLWSAAIYYRFIIADFFAHKIDKVIYLDSDVLCIGSINPLFDIALQNNVLAAATERNDVWWKNRAERLGEPILADGYFNSGVLIINIVEWQKQQITEKAMAALSDKNLINKITYFDQDVLNLVACKKVMFLDKKYNTQYSINYELKKDPIRPLYTDVRLIHYIGPTKPWHAWANEYLVTDFFLTVRNASPWKSSPLLEPVSSSQLRYAAKHEINKKNYFRGFVFYFKYFLSKIIKSE
ncbi:UDP-glucose:(glucosyl)LPS alpha-1,3-glucosyltransferase [Paramixta manurensis]|uniref:UDP-glucose:(Glucosyl)LPS alpha-1,3-glucosyltransferase n=2 Tax=Paramixta manurensis TaxID=2740817 RepID=A0A6M8UDV9_9GAMM|nr:UDP-glucose:(glucosyl)LPS alpha-1,3-glucosyltransferase [Erwiniaceae bacterium PD-1]